MKKIVLLLTLFLFVLNNSSFADETQELFSKGNELYKANDFEEASKTYLEIVNSGTSSFEVFFNLGNCYFRLGKVGEAVLYYEKAKKINSKDENLLYNLQLVSNQTIDRVELPEPDVFTKIINDSLEFFTLSELSYILIGQVWLFALGMIFFLWRRDKFLLYFSLLFLTTSLFSGAFLKYKYEIDSIDYVVVLHYEANAYSSPNKDAKLMFSIHEGTKAQVLEEAEGFYEVRLVDGKTGWIEAELLGKI